MDGFSRRDFLATSVAAAGNGFTFNSRQSKKSVYWVDDNGFVGDGKFDNTGAANALLNLIKINGGGVIVFPPGDYVCSLDIVDLSDIAIVGFGASSKIIHPKQSSDGDSVIKISAKTQAVSNVLIKDVNVQGTGFLYGRHDAFGIECNRKFSESSYPVKNIKVIGCLVRNTSSAGIVIRNAIDVFVSENFVSDTGRDGIQLIAENGVVSGNTIRNSGDDGIGCHGTVGGAVFIPSYRIINNTVDGVNGPGRGIAVAGAKNVLISENNISGYGFHAIMLLRDNNFPEGRHPIGRIVVSGNFIFESSFKNVNGAIALLNSDTSNPADFISIINNVVVGGGGDRADRFNPKHGVRFISPGGYRNIVIQGNSFSGLSGCGVRVELSNAIDYGVRVLDIRNNVFSRVDECIHLVGGVFACDFLIDSNRFEASKIGVVAFGVKKMVLRNNIFSQLGVAVNSSSSSIFSSGNIIDNASDLNFSGSGFFFYDGKKDSWS